MKRFLCIAAGLLMIAVLCCACALAESPLVDIENPDEDLETIRTDTYGLWTFRSLGQGNCIVTGYLGTAADGTEVTCPDDLTDVMDENDPKTEYHVTAFADEVFKGMTFLTSVTLPDDTAALGESLMHGCTSLTTADLGDNATALGKQTFYGCRALTTVALPATLETIGTYAFGNCTVITGLELPTGLTTIGSSAFSNCSNLITMPLPNTVQTIQGSAFYGCNSLTQISLPDSLTSLGTGVFTRCSALQTVIIGSGLRQIDGTTFAGLPSLKTLTINSSYTYGITISDGAFANCPALQTAEIQKASIGSGAFSGDTGLKSFSMTAGNINGAAFGGCSMLETVTLGDGVNSLQAYAFSNLPALKTVTITGNISGVPTGAFYGDTALESITLNPNLFIIENYAFYNCSALTEFTIPGNVDLIGSSAFQGCTGLTEISLPAAVGCIDSSAFSDCTGLTEIEFADHAALTEIGSGAFSGCTALESVHLPASVTTVGAGAFPTTKVYCDPSSAAAKSISRNGGSFVSPDNETFGVRWLLDPADESIGLGLSVEQIWTSEKTIVIPENIGSEMVTEIGQSALTSCPTVENVTFPASVPQIPSGLCRGNERLVRIVIPTGVTNIGEEAFASCSKLSSVSLPNTLTRIEARAFDGCALLKTVTLSDNIREIGEDAFSCTKVYANLGTDTAKMLSRTGGGFVCPEYPLLKLKYLFVGGEATSLEVIGAEETAVTITIPEGVTRIAAHAFENNTTLQNITIGSGVTTIGPYAFSGSGVKAITLPDGVTEIPEYAFSNTAAMTSFTAAGVITEIGYGAFSGSAVQEITFANGLTKVWDYAFQNAAGMVSCELPDSVTEIGSYAFYGCRNLTAFTVPAGVKTIRECTFQETAQMETVQLPAELEEIEYNAFRQSGLASVTIPGTVKTIGNTAFYECQGLKTVTMSGNMTSIGRYAFWQCENLETVTMPATLETLDEYAFEYCKKLKDITLPAGLNTIPAYAFSNCRALTHVKIGDGTVEIGSGAFRSCGNLKSVELPRTLVKIGDEAFEYDYMLNLITIPYGVTTIGDNAFYQCQALSEMTLPDSVISLGSNVFNYCSGMKTVRLSSGLVSIPAETFEYCSALETVTIPEGIRSIGGSAFLQDTSLTAISIPQSVTSIDETAFDYINPSQVTVYCYEQSAADTYAQAKGFNIVYLNGTNALSNVTITTKADAIYMSPGMVLPDLGVYFEILPDPLPVPVTPVYTTDDATIAEVQQNIALAGIAAGDTTVRLTIQENTSITAAIPVYVRPEVTDFTIGDPIWQKRDETLTLKPTGSTPAGVTDGFTWTIDRALGQISGNVLTPTAFGTGTLTATSWNGITKTATIHIYEDPTEISFSDVPAGMDIGMTTTLQPKVRAGAVFTGDEARHFITYSSSDESIATVSSDGTVTATGYGTAVITATADNGCTGTANIHVSPPITAFNLQTNMRAPIGVTIDLAVTEVMPENANLNAFSWSVDPAGLAEYHNGKVTVLTDQECEVHITATSWNGVSKTTDLYIYRPDVTGITIEDVNEWNWVPAYSDIQLTATVEATNTFTNQLITWRLDDGYGYYSGTYIDQNGVLHTGSGGYEIRVIAEADNGVSAAEFFHIGYPTTSFDIESRYAIQTGETVIVEPVNTEGNYCVYRMRTGTPGIATTDGMSLTGVAPGKTELTVTTWNGTVRKAEVLVYDPIREIEVTQIESINGKVSKSDPKHHIFATMNFRAHSAAISDKTYTDDLVTWTSSNPAVIRVTNAETGEFRTVTFGEATLTATAKNGRQGQIDLHVYKEVDSFKLPEKITAYVLAEQELEVASYLPGDAYDGFVWEVPAAIGSVDGQTLHVTAEQPTTGTITCTSWDGFITHTTALEIIQEPVTAVALEAYGNGVVDVGGVYQMTAYVTAGAEYINTFVNWSSSDESIATVDSEGRVTAGAEGTVTITATAADNEEIYDSITLEAVQGVDSFSTAESVELYPDEEYTIEISDIQPEDAANRPFVFTSGDESIVKVTDGVIRPQQWADGETTVTAASWNGVSQEIRVTVKNPAVSGISIDEIDSMVVSEQRQILASVTADGQTFENRFVSWSTSDGSIITIDERGVATAHASGSAYIYVTSRDGMLISERYVYVNDISSLSVNGGTEIAVGGTADLRETVSGWSMSGTEISGKNLTLSWSSDDESIATVDAEGILTGVGKGSTTITASYAAAGLSAEIPVTVRREVTAFDLPGRITVAVGAEAADLPALNMAPEGTDASDLIWSAEPEGVVTIEDGKIRAVTEGDAEGTITARNISGTVTKRTKLTVYSPWVDRIELEPIEYLPYNQETQIIAHVYAGDEEFTNQLVTFKAYHDSDFTEYNDIANYTYFGYINSRTGVIYPTYNDYTYYIVATAENGVQASMAVRCAAEYTDFTITNPVLVNVYEGGYTSGILRILSYESVYGHGSTEDFSIWTEDTDKISFGYDSSVFYVYPQWDGANGRYHTGIFPFAIQSANGVRRETKAVVYEETDITGVSLAPVKANHPIYESISLQALADVFGEAIPGNQFVTWSSDAPKVISVNTAGGARTLGYGTATITATLNNGMSASVTLNVLQESSNFTLPAEIEMTSGETITLGYESAEPEDAVMELSWTAEPADAVTIEGSELTATAEEETTVILTATNWDGTTRTTTLRIHPEVKLKTLTLPGSLTEIEDNAFEGGAFEAVIIPDGCTYVGHEAFKDCGALVYVSCPADTEIETDAFNGCGEIEIVRR